MDSLRNQVLDLAAGQYGGVLEHSWPDKSPNFVTLKHPVSMKWFGLVADIPGRYIGMPEVELVDVMNVKADPLLISSLVGQNGFHPAWHMNKQHWITVRLDGSVSLDQIQALMDMSFGLVAPKRKTRLAKNLG